MKKAEPLNEYDERTKQCEQRLIALMKATSDVIFRMSPDWKTMAKLNGHGFLTDTDENDPDWLNKYIHPDEHPYLTEVIQSCIKDKKVFKLEHRVLQDDGSIGWLYSRAIPILETNGEIKEWFGAASDITESKKAKEAAEEALRESEERFRAVQENSLDRFTILKPLYDSKGEIFDFSYIYLNAKAAKTTRRRPEELIGLRMTEVLPFFQHTRFFAMYKLAAKTGQVTEFENSYINDGINESFHVIVTPMPGSIAVATQIITDRKRTEEALRESESTALHLVEELNTVKDDLSNQIKALNKLQDINSHFIQQDDIQTVYNEILEAVIQLSNADFGNMQIARDDGRLEIIAAIGFSETYIEFFRFVDGPHTTCAQAIKERKRVITKDITQDPIFIGTPGLKILLDEGIICVQSTPLYNRSGKLLGVFSTHYKTVHSFSEQELRMLDLFARQTADVIEKSLYEEALKLSEKNARMLVAELEEADKNKNQFIGVLSHELRNPLAAISAGVQILELTQDRNQTEKAKEIMKRQTNQLCKLVDDLLELTRISQNRIRLKKESINLNDIIKGAVEDIRPEYEKKDIRLKTKIQAKPILLNADPVRVTQAIGNILFNALKFTNANGTVWMTLKAEKNNAVISVKDNGIGINPELLQHLFKPFTQADNSLHRNSGRGGLGLGLSIVKGIVDLHEGEVCAYSDGLGKGSTFTIRLPITTNYHSILEKAASGNNVKKSSKLLIIEDNRDFADLLRTMLSTVGYGVNIAYDGEEGIKLAKQIKPDVILCDIGLPGINGYDVAESIRKDNELKEIYLIAMTGYAGKGDIERVLKAGFNKHLAKPIDFETLKNVLFI